MSDLYDIVDNIKDKNHYPDTQPDSKQRPSNPEGDVVPETVDYFQLHPLKEQFNEPSGSLSVYDPEGLDRQYMDIVESEVISLTSPPIKYYKLNKTHNNIDALYGEARRRDAYSDPVVICGHYEDPSPEQELTQWGMQELEEIELNFNYNHLLHTAGVKDKLHIGDILQTYDAKLWEIMTSILIDEAYWRAQHNKVVAKRLVTEGIFLPDHGNITRSPNLNLPL